MSIFNKLNHIQTTLKAPKDKHNNFGNYDYRSCEGILEAVKPLLAETGLVLTVSDEMVDVGGRIYVKATATIYDGESEIKNTAYAREEESKKGMDASQLTGSTSSYARKYALNGLFCIDDNRDADETNTHGKEDNQFAKEVSKEKARETREKNKKVEEASKSEEGLKLRYESAKACIVKFKDISPVRDAKLIERATALMNDLLDAGMETERKDLYDNLNSRMLKTDDELPSFA
ncbi:MAG: ERF family protein [Bacteroidales bacterium]|nr:ERF family protein [Candidatus Scybalousia scybalohippi]